MKKVIAYLKTSFHFFIMLIIIFIILYHNYVEQKKFEKEIIYNSALIEAKNSFNKDVIYRKWAALEGGVYVPITEYTPPNPYLKVPDRDIQTKDGKKLTLVNPAYMTRMVHELEENTNGVKGHITSLNPIRPENKPDDWEKDALINFEKGLKEKHEIVEVNGEKVLRYIAPFITEKPCLKCHAQQGYKEGQIRGGISVSVPLTDFESITNIKSEYLAQDYIFIFTLVLVYLIVGSTINFNQRQKIKKENERVNKLNDELNESIERFKALQEASLGGLAIHDKGIILECNQGLSNMTGYSINELIGMNGLLLIAPESREIVIENINKGMEEPYEVIGLRKNGEKFPLFIHGKNIKYKGKQVRTTEFRDLTEQKKYINEINEAKTLYQSLFENNSDGVVIINTETAGFIEFNEQTCKQLGYSKEEFSKLTIFDIEAQETPEEIKNRIKKVISNGKDEFLTKQKTKHGEIKDIYVIAQIIKINDKYIYHCIWKDVTEQKKYEYEIIKAKEIAEENEKKFKMIFEHSPIAKSLSSTNDGRFFLVNKKFEELSEYTKEEIIGKTSFELNLWRNPDERNKIISMLQEKGFVEDLFVEFFSKNNKSIYSLVNATLSEDKNYIITSIQNISERINYERIIRKEKELYSFINYLHTNIDKIEEMDFYDEAIEYAVKLTNSKYGFLHKVSEDQKQVILTTWNKEAKENCNTIYNTHYPINEAGNWIDCIKTKKAVIYNDYINSPNQKGLPLGHVEIEKFMSIATYVNDKPFLIFGVGNKYKDYDEVDARNLELFANELSKLIEKKNFIHKIQENERFLSTLINNLPGFIYRCANDKNWTMYYLSENSKETTAYNVDELINNSYLSYNDIILPEFRDYVWNEIQNAIEKHSYYELEYKIKMKDEKEIWVWEKGQPIFKSNGELSHLEGFITDITDKKLLQEEKFILSSIIENSLNEIYIFDSETLKFQFVNKGALNNLGYTQSEILNLTPVDLKPEFTYETFKSFVEKLKTSEEELLTFETYHRRKNGNTYPVEVHLQYHRIGNKKIFFAIINDITERKQLSENIKNLTDKYRRLIEEMYQGLAVHEAIYDEKGNMIDYKFIDMNKSFEKMLGIKKEDFIGKTVLEVLPNTEKYWIDTYAEVVKTGNPIDFENYAKDFDKHFHVVAYKNEENQFAVIVTDITNRKKLEEKIRESENKFRRLTENAQDLIYRYEFYPKRGFTFVSKSATEITGYTPEDHYNDPDLGFKLVHDDDKYLLKNIVNASEEVIKKPITLRWIKKNGDIIWTEQRNVPIYDENGNLIAVEGIARDITQLMKYENELLKFKYVVDQSTISVVITNLDGNIEYVNKNFEETTGYTYEEVKNQNPRILSSGYHPKEYYEELWNTIKSGNTWRGIFRNKKKNGKIYYEDAIISPIKDKNNNIINFVAVKDDITQRIKIEEELDKYRQKLEELVQVRTNELQAANEELVKKYQTEKELELKLQEALSKEKELNELKTKFIASVSHEFRTPLTAILSSVQIIKRYGKKLDEQNLEKHYSKIEMVTNHIVNLLDDILLISRAEREILKNNPQIINLSDFIDITIQLHNGNLKEGQKINLLKNIKRNEIFIDEKLLQHIINNLLSNAIKYSGEYSIIDLEIKEVNDNLKIVVKDRGIGIPENELQHIFDAFYRTDISIAFKGTGLGLNIVKRCVEIMNGKIEVESKVNEGSTFTVTIPLENYEKENTFN